MEFLRPDDGPQVTYEFFSPFAHVEGRYEVCRIRSPTHGVFDTFIVLDSTPAAVYVASDAGARFMSERYPEVSTHRVPARQLRVVERDEGRTVSVTLRADVGPVRRARLTFKAPAAARPRNVPYGGQGKPVWGSRRWTCWGVDLVLDAVAGGHVENAGGARESFDGAPALLTLGSFGRIAPLPGAIRSVASARRRSVATVPSSPR